MPQDFVWRILSRKFLCVVFFFWLVIVNHIPLTLPIIGTVGAIGMETSDLLLVALVFIVFIVMEGRADYIEREAESENVQAVLNAATTLSSTIPTETTADMMDVIP